MEMIKFVNEVACQPFLSGTAVLSNTGAISYMKLFRFRLKLIRIRYNWKFKSSVTLATFQVLKSRTQLVASIADSADVGNFHHCSKRTRKRERQGGEESQTLCLRGSGKAQFTQPALVAKGKWEEGHENKSLPFSTQWTPSGSCECSLICTSGSNQQMHISPQGGTEVGQAAKDLVLLLRCMWHSY